MPTEAPWNPEWAVAPGEILREALDDRDMSQTELARRMDRPIKTINEIIKGKAAITPETALQLELTLGIEAQLWMQLESNYRASIARRSARESFEQAGDWAKRFPMSDLVRRSLIPASRTPGEALKNLLAFFRVSSPRAWERQWAEPAARFRKSEAFESSLAAVAAWLRWGEIEAEKIEVGDFSPAKFSSTLQSLHEVTRLRPFQTALERASSMCAEAGIVVLALPDFKGTRLSGAARWLSPTRPVIQLTFRYKTDDQFWFSLAHEAGHLLLHPGSNDYVDEDIQTNSAEEQEADKFANELLIPARDYSDFLAGQEFSRRSVIAFATRVKVAPSIVVARLQHDGMLPRSHLNELKQAIKWSE